MKQIFKEGGPGSGVKFRNTAPMGLPMSEYISVGTRKGLLNNGDYELHDVPLDMVTKVAQKNYVPHKVDGMMQNKERLLQNPIDVLWVRGDGYHLVDGHHRFMAAKSLNMETLPARVFRKSEKSMPDYVHDNPDRGDEMQKATRTTNVAANPGLDKFAGLMKAAEALERGQFDRCHSLLEDNASYRLEVSDVIQQIMTPSAEYSMGMRINLAKMLGGKIDEDGNIVWDDEVGRHVLSFDKSGQIAELQDETGVYKLDAAEKRLYHLMFGYQEDDNDEEEDDESLEIGLPFGGNTAMG